MSSAEEDYNDGENSSILAHDSKKRRVQRACDTCRRKKIRCDGSQMPGNRCSNCVAYNFECTYAEAAKKRGPPKGYVESLETRLEKMEKLLRKVCPDADFSQELGVRIDRNSWQRGSTGASTSGHVINATSSYNKSQASIDGLVPSDDEGSIGVQLSEALRSVSLSPIQTRFFGKSSGIKLIQQAIDFKKEVTGTEGLPELFFYSRNDSTYPWERAATSVQEPVYTFPEEDLGRTLVALYFTHLNCLIPLLHRPSFERKLRHGVHLRDSAFAAVYLLVCAVGSRFTDDPRVFLDDAQPPQREQSSGWKYFQQVHMVRVTMLGPPCLEDLQIFSLSVFFLQATSAPQACWTTAGIGIRLAQDVGAHRRKSYSDKPSVEGELWKRAFWVLVVLDRQMSSSLGRPCAIQEEDFDLDLPIECDDEYWEHPDPEQAFKQPPDKPSIICFFTQLLRLHNIMSFALRTIYSINKSKILLGFVGQQWEQHIVAELDSSLNKWIDEVPDHLRWDPTRDVDSPFFMQSSALYANYYVVQIFVHRPFIPLPRKPSPLSFPSLAICTNAARSCSHVMDIYRKRSGSNPFFLQLPAFTAGIVLLLNLWGGKKSGLSTDPLKEMADVHKCMAVLKACENRCHSAGRLWDILYELASVGDLPLPQPSPQGTKRDRDSDSPTPDVRPFPNPNFNPKDEDRVREREREREEVRTNANTRRAHSHSRPQSRPQTQTQQPSQKQPVARWPAGELQTYNLPVYSNDLGRLPVHGQVDFSGKAPTVAPTTGAGAVPSSSAAVSVSSSASASAAIESPSMFARLSSDGPHHRRPPPHASESAAAMRAQDLMTPNGFSIEQLFYGHVSAPPFSAYPTTPSGLQQAYGAGEEEARGGLRAFMGGGQSSMGQQPSMGQSTAHQPSIRQPSMGHQPLMAQPSTGQEPNGMLDLGLDLDTMAMWSSAPTGFGVNDWGAYLSNVVQHPAGSWMGSQSQSQSQSQSRS